VNFSATIFKAMPEAVPMWLENVCAKGFMLAWPSSEGIAMKLHEGMPDRMNLIAKPGTMLDEEGG